MWPDQNERAKISSEIKEKFDFPHCVGIADGTLFPLACEPETEDAPDYSGRKYGYSLSTMVICDHNRRIRHYLAGFPGSAHDNRIFKATIQSLSPEEHFDKMQYLIGDSAFENKWFMVSAFKKPRGTVLPPKHEKFNSKLSSLRIVSEHCIGMLKGRFPWLRSIRMKIKATHGDKRGIKSLKRMLKLLEATVALHNMLIEIKELEKREWIDEDDASNIDNPDRAPTLSPTDIINQGIHGQSPKDERRTRLMHYFEENIYF
jgi:hypothetical protein